MAQHYVNPVMLEGLVHLLRSGYIIIRWFEPTRRWLEVSIKRVIEVQDLNSGSRRTVLRTLTLPAWVKCSVSS